MVPVSLLSQSHIQLQHNPCEFNAFLLLLTRSPTPSFFSFTTKVVPHHPHVPPFLTSYFLIAALSDLTLPYHCRHHHLQYHLLRYHCPSPPPLPPLGDSLIDYACTFHTRVKNVAFHIKHGFIHLKHHVDIGEDTKS
jgi:hypothetical protein